MAEKLHIRIEELHRETIATRERTRSARCKAEAKSEYARKALAAKRGKAA